MTATTDTGSALAALRRPAAPADSSWAQRAVDGVTGWLSRHTSRRGFLVRAGLVGSALAVDPKGYVLRPGTAYASVCGDGASCTSGWTVFCATINRGINACPPGSIAAGWWKADGAPLCGGSARYIIDCNATCSQCTTAGARAGICDDDCWSCRGTCGPSSSCDQRRVCENAFRYGQCNTSVRQVGGVHCRVVSCTPPWRFENCSTTTLTDNRTVHHNSDRLPTRYTAITRRYIAIGENGSVLGASVYGEFATAGGRAQRYQAGRISWSSATGAWETRGAIGGRYRVLGYESSPLGFPLDRERATSGGSSQRFAHGRISWSSDTGAWETRGAIGRRYAAVGAETGRLGFPVAAEADLSGGAAQPFAHGRISWSSATGAWETYGAIGRLYLETGAESAQLGFPIGAEADAGDGGRRQQFAGGRISWSSATDAHWTGAAIAAEYVRLGAESGSLGFPTTDEHDVAAEDPARTLRRVRFEHGALTYDPATGEVTRT